MAWLETEASILSDDELCAYNCTNTETFQSNRPLLPSRITMPVNLEDLETAIRDAIPVTHLKIEDQSSGCGENYAIILVSEAR